MKLLDYSDEAALEASANPFATVVLAHLKTMETRRDARARHAWKIRLVRGMYERGFGRKEIIGLFRFIDWIMDLPKDLDREFWHDLQELEEGKQMPYVTSIERLAREEGQNEGREKGREEGLREGYVNALQDSLTARFGKEASTLFPAIERVATLTALQALSRTLQQVTSLDEVRKLLEA